MAEAAESPASPAPIRAYYALRRAAAQLSSSVLVGAVQVAILTALASVCPVVVEAPDKARPLLARCACRQRAS